MITYSILAVCRKNGVQDNGETGVDCGGGECPACGKYGVYLLRSLS